MEPLELFSLEVLELISPATAVIKVKHVPTQLPLQGSMKSGHLLLRCCHHYVSSKESSVELPAQLGVGGGMALSAEWKKRVMGERKDKIL